MDRALMKLCFRVHEREVEEPILPRTVSNPHARIMLLLETAKRIRAEYLSKCLEEGLLTLKQSGRSQQDWYMMVPDPDEVDWCEDPDQKILRYRCYTLPDLTLLDEEQRFSHYKRELKGTLEVLRFYCRLDDYNYWRMIIIYLVIVIIYVVM